MLKESVEGAYLERSERPSPGEDESDAIPPPQSEAAEPLGARRLGTLPLR